MRCDDEYFSDGLADEIINTLARIPGLKVTARTSALAFKGWQEDIRRIADVLGVTNVLEGSVRKVGSRIRVMAQLVAAADGSNIWSERYDRDLSDVFAVQDEITAAITTALKVKLADAAPAIRHYTPNLAAYEHYLRALYETQRWTPESSARAREHSSGPLHSIQASRRPTPSLATSSLEIEPSLPEAHAMLGTVAAMFDYQWPKAERQFRAAMANDAVSPGSITITPTTSCCRRGVPRKACTITHWPWTTTR